LLLLKSHTKGAPVDNYQGHGVGNSYQLGHSSGGFWVVVKARADLVVEKAEIRYAPIP
jgi:hypothetical protein